MYITKVKALTLSDASIVYDVELIDEDSSGFRTVTQFPCISQKDATRFAKKLTELINDHVTADAVYHNVHEITT